MFKKSTNFYIVKYNRSIPKKRSFFVKGRICEVGFLPRKLEPYVIYCSRTLPGFWAQKILYLFLCVTTRRGLLQISKKFLSRVIFDATDEKTKFTIDSSFQKLVQRHARLLLNHLDDQSKVSHSLFECTNNSISCISVGSDKPY